EADDQPFLLGIRVDGKEILPAEALSPGVEEPKAARFGDLVYKATVFLIGQLAAPGFLVCHRQVVVGVGAFQWAASGPLDRSIHGDPVCEEPLVKPQAELAIV